MGVQSRFGRQVRLADVLDLMQPKKVVVELCKDIDSFNGPVLQLPAHKRLTLTSNRALLGA